MNFISVFFALIFSFLGVCCLSAQVTIGSKEPPALGAILDLKEENTTTKGLGLPRVELKYLKIPTGEASLATTIKDASGEWDVNKHIGLVVYNVSEVNCDPRSIAPGMYVWDGSMWQTLTSESKSPEVDTFKDSRDGEVYHYRQFGNAGIWMLENLRYVPKSEDGFDGYQLVDQATGDPEAKTYMYLRGLDPNDPNTDWRPEYGLLYSYSAATAGEQDGLEEDQGEGIIDDDSGVMPNPTDWSGLAIDGICPEGWRLPNDYDWNKLEEEVYKNPSKYSSYTAGNGLPFSPKDWDPSWNYSIDFRGAENKNLPGHSLAMQSVCLPLGSSDSGLNLGASLSVQQGGFNVYLTYEEQLQSEINHFAFLWTSSLGTSPEYGGELSAWLRAFYQSEGTASQQVFRNVLPVGQVMSAVRCVKK